MKFFLPFWFSDHVYASYDPWEEDWRPKGDTPKFIWQLDWPRLPADGILISRINLQKSKARLKFFNEKGVYEALGIPRTTSTFGDCGAWGYISEEKPPFEPKETMEFYRRMRFTHACTIDHIIFPETFAQRFERLRITLKNAKEMIDIWQSNPDYFRFELVGVVQGWDPESYYESSKQIIDMGFTHIAMGGQSRAPSEFTVKVLRKCFPLWNGREIKVHIFGLGRRNLFNAFRRYKVSSFDNAYHRRAWLSSSNNYELNDESYTAIRIPFAKETEARSLQSKVLSNLRELDSGRLSVSEFLETLRDYDKDRCQTLSREYERTLLERPWERCGCILCKELGIHVVVFRSNERNMRRGFHNLWNFYRRLNSDRETSNMQGLVSPLMST